MSRTFKTTKSSAQTLSQSHSSTRHNSEDARLQQLVPQAPGGARSGRCCPARNDPGGAHDSRDLRPTLRSLDNFGLLRPTLGAEYRHQF